MLKSNKNKFKDAVLHHASCSKKTMLILAELGVYISVNLKSMKTKENCEMVKEIPLNRLLIETNCP
jgi:TatD DNase family protein